MTAAAIVSRSAHNKAKPDTKSHRIDSNIVVIGADELARIKQLSATLTDDEKLRLKAEADEMRHSRQAKAKARKARMLQLEQFRRSQASEMSELDIEEMNTREALLDKARRAADEQNDDVKRMNQMVLYAKCVTIRDKQVQQAAQIKQENDEQEKLLDLMMEYERQKNIQRQRQIDHQSVAERKEGAKMVIHQMQEREKARLREKELKTQEGIQLLEQAIAREKQAEAEKLKRQKAGQALLAEIKQANQEQMKEKALRRQADIEEDRRIAAYIKNREFREQERNEQIAKLHEAKEKEKRKLIEAREKASDHQAEIDALRARRAHEENERRWRAQQAAQAEKQMKIQKELAAAREQQRVEKERKMLEQAMIEQDQFEKMFHILQEQQQKDAQREQHERQNRTQYAKVLAEQIAELEARKMDRSKVIDLGQAARRQEVTERAKLEAIKQAKLLELEKAGVPEKYQAELRSFKVLQTHSMKK